MSRRFRDTLGAMASRSRIALIVGAIGGLGLLGTSALERSSQAQPARASQPAPSPASRPPQPAPSTSPAKPQTPARPATSAPSTPSPSPAANPAPLFARADALAREIATLRGLPLRAPIQKEVVDKTELRRRLVEMTAAPKEAAALAREEVLLKHWGLFPERQDYRALLLDVLSEQIAGYYDSRTKRLTLTDDPSEDPEWSEMVLSHEIQHALQDQSYALEKFRDVPIGEDDAGMARLALIEGDGIAVMLAVMSARAGDPMQWSDEETTASLAEALAESTEPELANVPLAVREALAFPYRAGFAFVAELRRQQPWRAVDAAFRRPPVSTEQILHPARYLQNEAPLQVPKLALSAALTNLLARPAGANLTSLPSTATAANRPPVETVWGELGFALFLRSHGVDATMAANAAAGWGGDRVAVIQAPGAAAGVGVGVARMRWDSEADAREAQEAAVRAVDQWMFGVAYEHEPERTAWMDAQARITFVERRGSTVILAHHVPLRAARMFTEEVWKSMPVDAPEVTPVPATTPVRRTRAR